MRASGSSPRLFRGYFDAIVAVDLTHDLGRPAVRVEGFQDRLLYLPAKNAQSWVRRVNSVIHIGNSRRSWIGALRYYVCGFELNRLPERRRSHGRR